MKQLTYNPTPTANKFHSSTAFIRGIMGPVGSGKSVACCFELMDRAMRQEPSPDGVRRSRAIIARNTLPQLETTTIKTFVDWFPDGVFGKLTKKPPYTFKINFKHTDGTTVDFEVIFLALDKPDDVNKLLSLETTWFWANEAREMDKSIIDAATGRVGRYPSKKDKPDHIPEEQWPTHYGIILDTNPPDDSHWWFSYAEKHDWRRDSTTGLLKNVEDIPEDQRWEFFQQPSGLSPEAENIENLPKGYYERQCMGKTQEYINVYVHGNYGFVQHGLPVYQNSYNPDFHLSEDPLPVIPGREILVGVDCSGRNPAALFAQRADNNQIRILHEFVVEGVGAEIFSTSLAAEIKTQFPDHDFKFWGDPAGGFKTTSDERTYFDILKAKGIFVRPAPNIRVKPRIEAVEMAFSKNVAGKPYLIIDKARCPTFVRGLQGGYKYKRLKTSGEARYTPEPEKNRYSDVQDAGQYLICGMGEYKKMVGRDARSEVVYHGTEDWDI